MIILATKDPPALSPQHALPALTNKGHDGGMFGAAVCRICAATGRTLVSLSTTRPLSLSLKALQLLVVAA